MRGCVRTRDRIDKPRWRWVRIGHAKRTSELATWEMRLKNVIKKKQSATWGVRLGKPRDSRTMAMANLPKNPGSCGVPSCKKVLFLKKCWRVFWRAGLVCFILTRDPCCSFVMYYAFPIKFYDNAKRFTLSFSVQLLPTTTSPITFGALVILAFGCHRRLMSMSRLGPRSLTCLVTHEHKTHEPTRSHQSTRGVSNAAPRQHRQRSLHLRLLRRLCVTLHWYVRRRK